MLFSHLNLRRRWPGLPWVFYLFLFCLGWIFGSALIVEGHVRPNEAEVIWGQAQTLVAEGNPQQALAIVREGLGRFPDSTKLYVLEGEIYASLRKSERALDSYETALRKSPQSLKARWARWTLLARQGNLDLAVQELRQLQQIDVNNPLLHLRLARELRKLDRLEEALRHFREAVQLAPRIVGWRLFLSRALYDVLEYEAAQKEVDRVLQYAKKGSRLEIAARNLHGVVYGHTTDKGRRSQPFPNAQKSAVDGKTWALLREEAWQYMREGQYEQAKSVLQKIRKLRPRDHRAAYDLGKTFMALEQFEQAIESFSEGIRLSPDAAVYPDSIFRIGQCLGNLNRWDDAYPYFIELERIADWRRESTYAMNFPHETQVTEWLSKAKQHVSPLPASPSSLPVVRPISSDQTTTSTSSKDEGFFNSFQTPGFSSRIALMGRDSDFSWFRYVIPAGYAIRDDLQAGAHEFLPLSPGDTFREGHQEVYLVFGLALASYDEIQLSAECYLEETMDSSDGHPVSSDQVISGTNEQSGYFLLTPPDGGWVPGLYRVDLFMGDTIAASTQIDEVRFRIHPAQLESQDRQIE